MSIIGTELVNNSKLNLSVKLHGCEHKMELKHNNNNNNNIHNGAQFMFKNARFCSK